MTYSSDPKRLYITGLLEVKSYRIIQNEVSKVIKKYGLNSASEWFILSHIYFSENSKAAELATKLNVEPPLITNLTEKLEQAKLLKKLASKDDKRVKILVLTNQGAKLIEEIQKDMDASIEKLLEDVSEEDALAYERVLQKIIKNSSK